MIRIVKPKGSCPEILKTAGVNRTHADCQEFNNHPNEYLEGDLKMPVADNEIYGAATVKEALMTIQNGKCCFCERSRDRIELDIEHFRPKGMVKQSHSDRKKIYPGYYWLAYDWKNLYLSCKRCNTSFKQVYFPLANKSKRSRWHDDKNKVSGEKPLLINPSENTRSHIRFNNDAPYSRTSRGRCTIEELQLLERPELREARLKEFKRLKSDYALVKTYALAEETGNQGVMNLLSQNFDIQGAKDYLEKAVLPSSEFSSMAIDLLSDYVP